MGSQRVGHNWVTELNWTDTSIKKKKSVLHFLPPKKEKEIKERKEYSPSCCQIQWHFCVHILFDSTSYSTLISQWHWLGPYSFTLQTFSSFVPFRCFSPDFPPTTLNGPLSAGFSSSNSTFTRGSLRIGPGSLLFSIYILLLDNPIHFLCFKYRLILVTFQRRIFCISQEVFLKSGLTFNYLLNISIQMSQKCLELLSKLELLISSNSPAPAFQSN